MRDYGMMRELTLLDSAKCYFNCAKSNFECASTSAEIVEVANLLGKSVIEFLKRNLEVNGVKNKQTVYVPELLQQCSRVQERKYKLKFNRDIYLFAGTLTLWQLEPKIVNGIYIKDDLNISSSELKSAFKIVRKLFIKNGVSAKGLY